MFALWWGNTKWLVSWNRSLNSATGRFYKRKFPKWKKIIFKQIAESELTSYFLFSKYELFSELIQRENKFKINITSHKRSIFIDIAIISTKALKCCRRRVVAHWNDSSEPRLCGIPPPQVDLWQQPPVSRTYKVWSTLLWARTGLQREGELLLVCTCNTCLQHLRCSGISWGRSAGLGNVLHF